MGYGTETRVRQYRKGMLAIDIFNAAVLDGFPPK